MIFPLALPLDDENQSIGMYKSSSCRSHTKPKYPVASDLFAWDEPGVSNVTVFGSSESCEESEVDCCPVT